MWRPPLLGALQKEDNINTCGCHTTNDQSDSILGGTTWGIEFCGMINIPQASAQSDSRRNDFWNGLITTRRGKKNNFRLSKGTFHKFCDEVIHCFIGVGVENSHEKDTIKDRELGDQQRSKLEKEKIMEDQGLKKA